MTILATSKTRTYPGPKIWANCPKCGPDAPAITYQKEERMGVYFIPLLTQRETYVECAKCGSARLTGLTFDELAAYSPDEIDRHLTPRVSIVIKFMALAGALLFFLPFVSLGFGIAGYVASQRTGGWVKVASLIGIVLGTISAIGMTAIMLLADKP